MTFHTYNFDLHSFFNDQHIHKNLPDELLLDLVQYRTLQYFIKYAHPHSGMIRERSNSSPAYNTFDTVTTGGSGFGIMALIVGAERGWLESQDAQSRIVKMVDFLGNSTSHHGVFPHFMNGNTGSTIPFSKLDDGGDLVETSFLMMGLLCAREYFGAENPDLARKINALWDAVEWNHHISPVDKSLHWHWSQTHQYGMAHPVAGWNECLVTYVLGAASKDHAIAPEMYHDVWAKGKEFRNGHRYHGHELQLGPEEGGPLFMSQYSFLGIDPRGLQDKYADYEAQNRAHALINYEHCKVNPFKFDGYGSHCWGLTASDSTPDGLSSSYNAHSPTNDHGVIAPTAALAAMPYTPAESMKALRHFYEDRGEKIFGGQGFMDAFHASSEWISHSHLAIDQGPIVVMIENHRSGLLWNLAMKTPEVQKGLSVLGFSTPHDRKKKPSLRVSLLGPDPVYA